MKYKRGHFTTPSIQQRMVDRPFYNKKKNQQKFRPNPRSSVLFLALPLFLALFSTPPASRDAAHNVAPTPLPAPRRSASSLFIPHVVAPLPPSRVALFLFEFKVGFFPLRWRDLQRYCSIFQAKGREKLTGSFCSTHAAAPPSSPRRRFPSPPFPAPRRCFPQGRIFLFKTPHCFHHRLRIPSILIPPVSGDSYGMGCAYEFDRGGGQHANETGRGSWQGRRAGIQSMASGSLICCRAHPRELLRATQTKERQV